MRIDVSPDNERRHLQITFEESLVVIDAAPVLVYDDRVLTESQGGLRFTRITRTSLPSYQRNPDFPGKVFDVFKEYTIDLHGDPPSTAPRLILHAFFFPDKSMVYFTVQLFGLQRPIERIFGGIVLTFVPQLGKVRFLTTNNRADPRDHRPPNREPIGWDEFLFAWYGGNDAGISDQFPTDDALRISFLMAQVPRGTCAAVPVNDHGQRSLIRCGFKDSLDQLQLAFISGTPLPCNEGIEPGDDEPEWLKCFAGGIVKFGDDPIALSEDVFRDYVCLVNRPQSLRTAKPFPEMFEYVGFCTWNTFYRNQSLGNMERLAAENFTLPKGTDRFKYIIIDDGWQPTNEMDIREDFTKPVLPGEPLYLTSQDTNYKFPGGLAPVAALLKERHGFRWFGVWHTINGYWDGVHPGSPLAKKYRCVRVGTKNTIDPFAPTGFQFWLDYYGKLRRAGVELVKIDNSSAIANLFEGVYAFDDAAAQVIATEHGAAAANGITVLNCLGPAQDAKTHWGHANASRVTNDFSPASFQNSKKQVHQFATQALQMAPFCWPDADMFFSKAMVNELLIYLHMVSGGPVYFADEVGRTDHAVICSISFPDGRLPRLARPGYPTADVVFEDFETDAACKIWNYHDIPGWGRVFYMFVADVIVEDKPCAAQVAMSDIGLLAFKGAKEPPADVYIVKEATG
nr:Sip1-related alpha-galactosidase [Candidatus Sigynarchaeota archaeon]